MRTAEVSRNTKETQIRVRLNLDGKGSAKLATGVPFLDHMLDQVARHGVIDLEVEAQGDLHIDAHHTVEDIGIALGQAFARAIGDKAGVRRYGHAYVPLDEALSRVVVDLSGRPGLDFHVDFARARVGEFDVDLVHEFLHGFVNHALTTPTTSARRCSRHSAARCAWRSKRTLARSARCLLPRAAYSSCAASWRVTVE
jgi:imidazoleglycerol-phosphate dehydratase